jgi:hypothetical protein
MNTKHPRKRSRKRKCKHCGQLYMPDARHLRDQQYCGAPSCRIASKRASHRRWLSSPKGAEYRDPVENKRRVCQWRKANPGYWRRVAAKVRMRYKIRWIRNHLSIRMLQRYYRLMRYKIRFFRNLLWLWGL